MAKLTIDFDTEDQSLTVLVNGNAVSNVSGVNLYNWGYDSGTPQFVFEVMTSEEDNGVRKYSRLTANQKDGTPSKTHAGLFDAAVMTKAQKDILELMTGGRKV